MKERKLFDNDHGIIPILTLLLKVLKIILCIVYKSEII